MDFYLNLSIADLVRGLRDLLAERHEALALVDGNGIYMKTLSGGLVALEALPESMQALPLKELLALTDGAFDRDALVLHKLRELAELLVDPTTAAESAAQVFAKLAPAGITRRSYSDEAAHAYRQRQTPTTHRALLESFKFPDKNAPDAFVLAERFIQNGIKLDALISGRAGVVSGPDDHTGAGAARKQALEALADLRRHVARAVGTMTDLPRDLDDQIFGHLDELERNARHQETQRKPLVVASEPAEDEAPDPSVPPPLPF